MTQELKSKKSHGRRDSGSVFPHARKLLVAHAFVKKELLERLTQRQPTAHTAAERVRELEEKIKEGNGHFVDLRRIASYLGHDWTPAKPTTTHAAKQIRVMIESGDPDEQIALYLEIYLLRKKSRGRPSATYDTDGLALQALELHDSDPIKWNWPKLADTLLNCKSHSRHSWNSECTGKVKKAGERLRTFLKQLQSEYPILP